MTPRSYPGDYRPPDPLTRSLAGTPRSPLRSRGSLALARSLALSAGLSSPGPPHAVARGDPTIPAPLPRLPRSRSFARLIRRTIVPRTPSRGRSRGPHDPRSAPAAPSLSLVRSPYPQDNRPPDPLTRSLAGTPQSPLRSRGSLALARSLALSAGRSSPGPPHALARGGPTIPASAFAKATADAP